MDSLLKNNLVKEEQIERSSDTSLQLESVFIKTEQFDDIDNDFLECKNASSLLNIKTEATNNDDVVSTNDQQKDEILTGKDNIAEYSTTDLDTEEGLLTGEHFLSVVGDSQEKNTVEIHSTSEMTTEEENSSLEEEQIDAQDELEDKNCKKCGKPFEHNCHYDCYLQLQISSETRSFMCDICKRAFNCKRNLNSHMLVHTDEKPYQCEICNKKFKAVKFRNRHAKLMHSDAKFVLPYACDQCEKRFRNSAALIRHSRKHTGDKPFICDMCNKAFSQNFTLIRHKLIHTGEKPFSCEVCTKSFSDKSNLDRHKRQHKNLIVST